MTQEEIHCYFSLLKRIRIECTIKKMISLLMISWNKKGKTEKIRNLRRKKMLKKTSQLKNRGLEIIGNAMRHRRSLSCLGPLPFPSLPRSHPPPVKNRCQQMCKIGGVAICIGISALEVQSRTAGA